MAPDMSHILTYLTVVEQGSFTKAAAILRVSKSVVSKHIGALEEALACQLLQRSTRKLVVTEIGQHYYQSLKSIPNLLADAQELIHNYQSEPAGLLKVIAPANFESSLKVDVVRHFLTQNPKVKLHLEFEQRPQDHLDGDFDVIILWKLSQENFPSYNLISKKLFSMPVGVYAAPKYLQKHGTPKVPEDLLSHNCFSTIDFKWPFKTENDAIEYVGVSGNIQTKSVEIIHEATVQGLGIAYSYPVVFQQALKNKSAVKLLENFTQLYVDVVAFYRQSAYKQAKVSAFIQSIQAYYQKRQDEILKRGQEESEIQAHGIVP
jgi:DNA-binding transcriptional LysR family regulator